MARPEGGGPEAARLAEVRALRVAQEAAAHVPAYARFLRQHGYDAARLRSFADFCALPIMDKDSYLRRYPLADRCLGGEIPRSYIVISSSGTSGAAMLWPRLPEQEPATVAGVRAALEEHFQISQRWSLVVIAAAMGPWAYGTGMTLTTQRIFAEGWARGTVVTPGLNVEETLRFVAQLGPHYDQTILVSYPTLLPTLLEQGKQQGLDWPALNVGVVTAGEGATEAQRERILRLLGKDPEQLEGFVAVFGASEIAGTIGYETRLCLLLRRLCTRTPALAEALFGSRLLPSLVQYNPLLHFLEPQEEEVLLTMRGAAPLVRYNTHDRGGLLAFEQVVSICRTHGYDLTAEVHARGHPGVRFQPLPLLYVHGRSDAVTFHSVNVYLDEIVAALEQPELCESNTGNFEVCTDRSPDGVVTLRLLVELREKVVPDAQLRALYESQVLRGLVEASPRFRATYEASRDRTVLAVDFVPSGTLHTQTGKHRRTVTTFERPPTAGTPPVEAPSLS